MALATRFVQPMDYTGQYKTSSWAGYTFKEALGYATGRHTGVDYNYGYGGNDDLGQPVRAIANGVVRYVGDHSRIGFGRTVIIEHPLSESLKTELGCDSLFSRYMHLQRWDVSVGQEVSVGQAIGTCGNSGTTWAHLHLDLYKSTITGGGVHLRYDKDSRLESYLDSVEFINAHSTDPSPALQPFQRVVGPSGVNIRKRPDAVSEILGDYKPGEILDFKGYVRGGIANGSNIWFVGRYKGHYFHSRAFTDNSTTGLEDITEPAIPPNPPPTPPTPTPVEPSPTPSNPPDIAPDFPKELACVTRVIPAHSSNYQTDNFPAKPRGVVLHDFGTDGKDTLQSSLNHFAGVDTTAPHITVSGREIIQNGKLSWRMYHAGPKGNDKWGIEIDPDVDTNPDTQASVRTVLKELDALAGAPLTRHKHSEFMTTVCGDEVDLAKFQPDLPTDPDELDQLNRIEAKVDRVLECLSRVFK